MQDTLYKAIDSLIEDVNKTLWKKTDSYSMMEGEGKYWGNVFAYYKLHPINDEPIQMDFFLFCVPISYSTIQFCVYGSHGRKAFRELYLNYPRLIQLLLKESKFKINIDPPFSKKRTYGIKELQTFLISDYSDEYIYDCNITLEYSFSEVRDYREVISATSILMILYDCIYHYLSKRKDYDRILKQYTSFKENIKKVK